MIAFIHIPKTAGSSVNRLLRSTYGLHHCDLIRKGKSTKYLTTDEVRKNVSIWPFRLESIASHDISPLSNLEKDYPSMQYYTFLRDPVERCISHYQYHIKQTRDDIPFEKWVEKKAMQNLQCQYFSAAVVASEAISCLTDKKVFVGLVDDLENSIEKFSRQYNVGLSSNRLTKENVSKHRDIFHRVVEDDKQLKMARDANSEDMKLYEYVRNSKADAVFKENIINENGGKDKVTNTGNLTNLYYNRLLRNLYFKPIFRILD